AGAVPVVIDEQRERLNAGEHREIGHAVGAARRPCWLQERAAMGDVERAASVVSTPLPSTRPEVMASSGHNRLTQPATEPSARDFSPFLIGRRQMPRSSPVIASV